MNSARCPVAVLALAGLVWATGCVERREPAGQAGAQDSGAPAAAPASAPSQPQPSVEGYLRNLADAPGRTQRQLDLAQLQRAVEAFSAAEGRRPQSLQELVDENYLPRLPAAPTGQRLTYDPQTGRVGLVAQ
jgi:hypothetical protein